TNLAICFQIYSLTSNVSVNDSVLITSTDSEVCLNETFLNGKIWSNSSTVKFHPHGQTTQLSAENNVNTLFDIDSCTQLHTASNNLQFSFRLQLQINTNRSDDGHSALTFFATFNINLTLSYCLTGQLEVVGASWLFVRATTWRLNVSPRLTLTTNFTNGCRNLTITILTKNYSIIIDIIGGTVSSLLIKSLFKTDADKLTLVGIKYGKILLQLSDNHRALTVYSANRILTVQTVTSPIGIFVNESHLNVRFTNEDAVINAQANSSDVQIIIQQFAKLIIQKNGGELTIANETQLNNVQIEITALCSSILLRRTDVDTFYAYTNNSQLHIKSNTTQLTAIAESHTVEATDGQTNVSIITGNISATINTAKINEPLVLLIPPFRAPQNAYINSGPYDKNADESDIYANQTTPNRMQQLTSKSTTTTNPSTLPSLSSVLENLDLILNVTSSSINSTPTATPVANNRTEIQNSDSMHPENNAQQTANTTMSTILLSSTTTTTHTHNLITNNQLENTTETFTLLTQPTDETNNNVNSINNATTQPTRTEPTSDSYSQSNVSSLITNTLTRATITSTSPHTPFLITPQMYTVIPTRFNWYTPEENKGSIQQSTNDITQFENEPTTAELFPNTELGPELNVTQESGIFDGTGLAYVQFAASDSVHLSVEKLCISFMP
uniref:DUF2807 domain-containing protein n=1 Tax=Syphacia muris TaxID=451379 RepID=A0A0N5AJX1_9BILA